MNPVLILTRNCLELTKRCIESVRAQDIPTEIHIYDNGSTDGTEEWLCDETIHHPWMSALLFKQNRGVSHGWNHGLNFLFNGPRFEHCLVIGNDTVVASWTFRTLLNVGVPFVTGVDSGMDPLPESPDILPLSPHPDFSCFLIRRSAWEKIGPFDEQFVHYCGDCDYHIRAHRLGVPLWKASVPYNHERSSTIRLASPEDARSIHARANLDRVAFRAKYGCLPGEPAYDRLFAEVLHG